MATLPTLQEVDVSDPARTVKPIDDVTPQMRFNLAVGVIGGLGLLLLGAAVNYQWHADAQAAGIWSFTKAGVFPLLASVIGYYFRGTRG